MAEASKEAEQVAANEIWNALRTEAQKDSVDLAKIALLTALPIERERWEKEVRERLGALQIYGDEEIAARRGPMERWVRIDAALDSIFDKEEKDG